MTRNNRHETITRTNRVVERIGNIVVLLPIQLLKYFTTILQLLRGPVRLASLALSVLLWQIGIRQIFGWRGMDFTFRTRRDFSFRASDNRNGGRSSASGLSFLWGNNRRGWRWGSGDLLYDGRFWFLPNTMINSNMDKTRYEQPTSGRGKCLSCLSNTSSIFLPI